MALREGDPAMPACVFVHGLGMKKTIWTSPARARVLGGMFPLKRLLRDYPRPRTLYHDLGTMGLTVAAWSQRRPSGPVEPAVEELEAVVRRIRRLKLARAGLVLIGHSRGGLAARAAVDRGTAEAAGVRALVTISSPHLGSTLARWAVLVSAFSPLVGRFVPEAGEGTLRAATRRAAAFLESTGVRELLPDSEFLKGLGRLSPRPGTYRLSAGGTDPELFTVAGRLSFPGTLANLLPRGLLPEEMLPGRGDGLVTSESSRLPGAREHLDFPLNHAEMLVAPEARKAVKERLLSGLGIAP